MYMRPPGIARNAQAWGAGEPACCECGSTLLGQSKLCVCASCVLCHSALLLCVCLPPCSLQATASCCTASAACGEMHRAAQQQHQPWNPLDSWLAPGAHSECVVPGFGSWGLHVHTHAHGSSQPFSSQAQSPRFHTCSSIPQAACNPHVQCGPCRHQQQACNNDHVASCCPPSAHVCSCRHEAAAHHTLLQHAPPGSLLIDTGFVSPAFEAQPDFYSSITTATPANRAIGSLGDIPLESVRKLRLGCSLDGLLLTPIAAPAAAAAAAAGAAAAGGTTISASGNPPSSSSSSSSSSRDRGGSASGVNGQPAAAGTQQQQQQQMPQGLRQFDAGSIRRAPPYTWATEAGYAVSCVEVKCPTPFWSVKDRPWAFACVGQDRSRPYLRMRAGHYCQSQLSMLVTGGCGGVDRGGWGASQSFSTWDLRGGSIYQPGVKTFCPAVCAKVRMPPCSMCRSGCVSVIRVHGCMLCWCVFYVFVQVPSAVCMWCGRAAGRGSHTYLSTGALSVGTAHTTLLQL
jgi:hypothetical protein